MKKYSSYVQLILLLIAIITSEFSACQNVFSLNQTDSIFSKYMIIEGDILVPKNFFDNKSCYATNFWPNGIVPFEFNANVTQFQQNEMLLAMAEWEAVANVDFIPRNGHSNYVHIFSTNANFSSVGMQGGQQTIGIFNWNWRFIMAHELCHALGFWHEHSRANRNTFIQVNYDCISDPDEHNFDIHSGAGHYGPYDFMSVMHYSAMAFYDPSDPNCTETSSITVLPPNQALQWLIGQRDSLTYIDRITMSFVYPEDNWRFVDLTNNGNQIGTFLEPWQQFITGATLIPQGGTLWIQPGSYSGIGTYTKEMTIRAPLGNVIIQ